MQNQAFYRTGIFGNFFFGGGNFAFSKREFPVALITSTFTGCFTKGLGFKAQFRGTYNIRNTSIAPIRDSLCCKDKDLELVEYTLAQYQKTYSRQSTPDRLPHLADSNFIVRMLFYKTY